MHIRAAAIITDKDQILVIERWKNGRHYFVIPGGTTEPGESLEETAIREIREETSLEIVIDQKVFEDHNEGWADCTYFTVKEFSGTPNIENSPEFLRHNPDNVYELKWMKLSEISKINLVPETIKNYLLDQTIQ